jgi:predicted dehydrogenase
MKAMPGVQIVALCDVTTEKIQGLVARRLAEYQPAPAFYTDYPTMLREARLDAVVIVTPHALHFEHAKQALAAGCHVFIEKPMVTNSADAHALAALARAAGKVVVVGYVPPFTPAMQYVRAAIRSGEFGPLQLVNGYLAQDWKRPTSGTWRHDPSLSGGGQVCDSGAHLLAGLCWAVGAPVAEVVARLDRQDARVDINSALLLRFANGVLATVAIGGDCASNGSHSVFVFSKGRIEVDGWGGSWTRVFGPTEPVEVNCPPMDEPNPDANFIAAIRGEAEALVTVNDGVVQAELLEAIFASETKAS